MIERLSILVHAYFKILYDFLKHSSWNASAMNIECFHVRARTCVLQTDPGSDVAILDFGKINVQTFFYKDNTLTR
jgi:hypothetical protein